MKTIFANKRKRRHHRVRARVSGVAARPRLSVFRSNRVIYAQVIDDTTGKTLAAASERDLKTEKGLASGKRPEDVGFTKVPQAFLVGKLLARRALENKINAVAFDRGGYRYAGRVKALADGAREGGLQF